MKNRAPIIKMNQQAGDISYRRYFQLLDMFIKEGAVFHMHPEILHFGENERRHYSISKYNLRFGNTYSIFNPCTSQEMDKNRKDVFYFSLEEDTTIKDDSHKITYLLLALSIKVQLNDLMKPNLSVYKGRMHDKTLEEYRKAKKEFILWKQNKRDEA